MATALRPTCVDELVEAIAEARREGVKLALHGGGSKADIGAPTEARSLDMRGFAGVVDYDPAELVLTVGTGTPLAEVEALVAGERQMLAFAPFDHGPIFGRPTGAATIGGVVAAGVGGSGRLSGGAPRDHLLGFRGVSGRGEALLAGARVVKNVTGYDLPKLAAGSWGRLVALTEITLKVLPGPSLRRTIAIEGLAPVAAVAAMAAAMGSPNDVAATAHLPRGGADGTPLTIFRLQGFPPSVDARQASLMARLGPVRVLDADEAGAAWEALATMAPLDGARALWRVNVPPSGGAKVVAALAPLGVDWLMDWAGGLVWLACDDAVAVRAAATAAQGHAMLVRAPAAMRAAVPAFHPPAAGVAALEARVRHAFDPDGLFETGRF